MALDTRIPLMVQSPQIESPLNRYGRVMQLRNMKQQGQLNQIQIDAAERQQRTAEQVRNALAAAQSAGKSPEEVVNDIMMIDPAAAEPFLRATKLQAQTGQATALTDKYKAQREETLRKIMRDRFVPIMAIGDPAMQQQAYQAWRQESIAIDPDDESVLPEQFDPRLGQAIMDSADAFMDRNTISATDAAKLEQGERTLAETERYHTGRLAQGPATRGDTVETALLKQGLKPVYNEQGEIVEMTSIPGSKADPKTRGDTVETAWAKQQVRPVYDEQGKVVALEPIPGGKADPAVQRQQQEVKLTAKDKAARDKAFPKSRAMVTKFEADADELIAKMEKLKAHDGLKSMAGYVTGRLGQGHPFDSARAASALFDQIMATGQFNELGELKQASSVGSAGLGSVSNFEQQGLREKFSALKPTLDYEDFVVMLDDTIDQVKSSKQRIRDQFELDYEYMTPSIGSGEWEVVE